MVKRGDPLIGRRVAQARERMGWTQEELAEQAGRATSTVGGIECASRPAGRETLTLLANALLVPIDYFTEGDDLIAFMLLVLRRIPREELEAWAKIFEARLGGPPLPNPSD